MKDTLNDRDKGPKYFVNIEGQEFPWHRNTITTEEITTLGGWDVSQGVVEVDEDNVEHTLIPGAVIQLKPGHGFAKKHKWKRGLLAERITQELELLRQRYGEVNYQKKDEEHWFEIPNYPVVGGWQMGTEAVNHIRIVFRIVSSLSAAPYGFLIPAGLNYKGQEPGGGEVPATMPFTGNTWRLLSWAPDEPWLPTDEVYKGSNLLCWCRSFLLRLTEGA